MVLEQFLQSCSGSEWVFPSDDVGTVFVSQVLSGGEVQGARVADVEEAEEDRPIAVGKCGVPEVLPELREELHAQ